MSDRFAPTPPATQPVKQDLTADEASERQQVYETGYQHGLARTQYTHAMGDAASKYYAGFANARPLPAQFRWSEVYEAMIRASGDMAEHSEPTDDRLSQIATIVKDVIESLMLWNGQASAGLDVRGLAGLRDEVASLAGNSADAGEGS
jgi:hypothetical protein